MGENTGENTKEDHEKTVEDLVTYLLSMKSQKHVDLSWEIRERNINIDILNKKEVMRIFKCFLFNQALD